MNLHNDILESIGNTPMVKVNNIDTGKCDLLLKLENLNPGGSIKDRVCLLYTSPSPRDRTRSRMPSSA